MIQVTDSRYPYQTVPGIVVLGGYAYVMDPSGLIRNCALNDPFHWPLLNAVGADYESDPGVALVKYLNYVVAFGTYTCQFFYDAGIINGSPLKPYLNANMRVGCAAAATVCNIGPTVVWMSRTLEYNRQIMMFNGLAPQVISTPAVDKMLEAARFANPYATTAYSQGHLFYIISGSSDSSLVYDFSVKEWYEWTNTDSDPFSFTASCSTQAFFGNLLLHATDGKVYRFDGIYNADNGTPFPVTVQTGLIDFDNTYNKFFGRTRIVGDKGAGTPTIQTTDDDYNTFSAGRTQDMDANWRAPARALFQEGAAISRAWKITQTDTSPFRWQALEVQYTQDREALQAE